jgi:hypothetical protein
MRALAGVCKDFFAMFGRVVCSHCRETKTLGHFHVLLGKYKYACRLCHEEIDMMTQGILRINLSGHGRTVSVFHTLFAEVVTCCSVTGIGRNFNFKVAPASRCGSELEKEVIVNLLGNLRTYTVNKPMNGSQPAVPARAPMAGRTDPFRAAPRGMIAMPNEMHGQLGDFGCLGWYLRCSQKHGQFTFEHSECFAWVASVAKFPVCFCYRRVALLVSQFVVVFARPDRTMAWSDWNKKRP